MRLTLGRIADWIHAEGDFSSTAEALGYSIDSRTIAAGELFFAVKGDRVDGHDYVEAALANGAVAAVVSMRWLQPSHVDGALLLRVPDEETDCVLQSLQRLANRVRREWAGRVIGVTGSAGKTTTKDCVAHVLASRFRVLKSEGNLNNHFGLPLQLLKLLPEHQVAVLEMGMNHAGEIRALARIAEPDWGVVSNVGPVHLEHFADGIDGIARAKYELIQALPETGIAVLNGDDERVAAFGRGMGDRAVLYGTHDGAAVRAIHIQEHGLNGAVFAVTAGEETCPVELHLPGRHNVLNALAAVATGLQSGIDLGVCCQALQQLRPVEKRGNRVHWGGAEIVNDTYNSNPQALISMIGALSQTPARRRILIAGEMLELGSQAAELHARCGEAAARAGIDFVLGVRGLARDLVDAAAAGGVPAGFVESPQSAGEWMSANLRQGDLVLLKASRGVRLEQSLAALRESSGLPRQ